MQPSFAQMSFRNNKRQLFQMRNERFSRNRKLNSKMQTEMGNQLVENIEDLDYYSFYPQEVRKQIDSSLKVELPSQLPALELCTISLYRRTGQSVYQCRRMGRKELQPHMVYQSLLMLAHTESKEFGNYGALTKQFERDFGLYLGMGKDIREMAVVAAGNKILGREQDVLGLVNESLEWLWVLINHTYQSRISSRHMVPFLLLKHQRAFKTFSQLTGHMRDESINVLAESDQVIECLMSALDQGLLCKWSLKIISNLLGQSDGHWKLFYHSKIMDKALDLLLKADATMKLLLVEMLCSYVCEQGAATALLRHHNLASFMVNMLSNYGGLSSDLQRELLNTFSFIVYKAEEREVFESLLRGELFQICEGLMGLSEELSLSSLQLVCGLVEVAQKFPNEKGQNVAGLMVSNNQPLLSQVDQLTFSNNNYISGLSITIIEKLREDSSEL